MNMLDTCSLQPSLEEIEAAAALISETIEPTPQIRWPLLVERCGCEVRVKHENHLPTGAFKVRGGLVYMDQLVKSVSDLPGIIAATRGNHGQSIAFAAAAKGIPCTVVVPHGNSAEKNRAMRAHGAELIEHGRDFNAAYDFACELAAERSLHLVPSFHPLLVRGVATGALELLRAAPGLDTVYVPIGLGSGICGMLAARRALGLGTEIVGVVAEAADAYARSFEAHAPVPTSSCDTIADGVALRVPDERALGAILGGVSRIVSVAEDEILSAIRHYFTDTHNLAEGAGALPLAALLRESERARAAGKMIGLVLSGGNIDSHLIVRALTGCIPSDRPSRDDYPATTP